MQLKPFFVSQTPVAQNPARQLNSQKVKQAAESYLLPLVEGKLCVVWLQCVWKVSQDEEKNAWENVCEKRAECNEAIQGIDTVAFYFSSISCQDLTGKNDNEKDGNTDQEDGLQQPSPKRRVPVISYWVCTESKNGAPISLVNLHRRLLKCDVDVKTKILASNSKQAAAKMLRSHLWRVLKDHSSGYMKRLVANSFQKCFQRAIGEINVDLDDEFIDTLESQTEENVLRFVVMKQKYSREAGRAVREMISRGLITDVVGVAPEEEKTSNKAEKLSSKTLTSDACTQLINDIEVCVSIIDTIVLK